MSAFMYPEQWPELGEWWMPGVPSHPEWGRNYCGVLCDDEDDRRFEDDYLVLGDAVAVAIQAENDYYEHDRLSAVWHRSQPALSGRSGGDS